MIDSFGLNMYQSTFNSADRSLSPVDNVNDNSLVDSIKRDQLINQSDTRDSSAEINIITVNDGSIWERFDFKPEEVIIYFGNQVIWKNNDSRVHTINITDSQGTFLASSSYLAPVDTFSYTFTAPGKYSFYSDLATHYNGNVCS